VDGRDQQQAEGIGQCPGPEDIGDTERHDEKAGQGEEEQLPLDRALDGEITRQPGITGIDPHQGQQDEERLQVVARGVRVRDQARQLRDREDEDQVEE